MPFDPTLMSQGDKFYYSPEGVTPPLVGDGKTYSRALGWQSPEGNFYGQERWVRDWPNPVVWNGIDYQVLELSGVTTSVELLPIEGDINPNTGLPYGPRRDFETWSVPRANWSPSTATFYDTRSRDYYYWDVDFQQWKIVTWYWDIEDEGALPRPGLHRGAAHILYYYDIKVMWDGLAWRRWKHSSMEDDEPYLHLPRGFIEFLIPDSKLEYYGKGCIGLRLVDGGNGFVFVGSEKMVPSDTTLVHSSNPVLTVTNGVIVPEYIEPNTEYYIYYANDKISIPVSALPGDSTHKPTIAWDFSGRLFLSKIAPVNDYIDTPLLKDYAIIAGLIETDVTPIIDGGPFFRHNLDFSWISRRPSLSEAFRDYSDFYLSYIDPDEIRLLRMDGYYGQIYLPDELIYLGEGHSVTRFDSWISVNLNTDLPVYNDTPIVGNTHYWIYIINEIDAVNFNEINPITNRPWQASDYDSESYYDSEKDLRLKVVLSTKEHEHYRMTETFPLFYSRCIGHVWTDDNGRFLYAKDISYIKSLILNPTHFKGQADFAIKPDSSTQFKVAETEGTAGVVYVGGETLQTLPADDQDVHIASTNAYVQLYTEANIATPLSALNVVSSYKSTILYVYMANNDTCWGALKNKLFFSLLTPTRGYLSANWPGTSARWIATVKTDSSGLLTGYWLLDSPGKQDAALLNLNDIAIELSINQHSLIDHASFIDFLLGIGSFNVGLFDSLSDDLSVLYSIASDLRSDASELMDDVSDLGVITTDIGSDIVDLYSNASALSNNVSALGSNLDAMESNVEDIYSDIDDLYSDVSGAYDNISDMGSNFNEISDNVSDIQSNVTVLFSDLSGAESNLSGLYSVVSNFSGDLSTLDSAIDGAYSNVSDILSDLDNIDDDISDLRSEFSGMGDDISDMGSYIDNISENASNIGSNVEALFSNLSATDSYVDLLESYAGDLSDGLTDLTSLYSDIGSELASNVWSNMSAIEGNVSDIISDVSIINSTLSDIWEETSSISGVVSDINTNIGDIYSDVSATSGTINSIYSTFSDFSGALYSATSFLSDANSLMSNNVWSNVSGIYSELGNLSHGFDMLGSADTQISNNASLLASALRSEAASNFNAVSLRVNSLSTNLSATISDLNTLSGNLSLTGSNFNTLSNQLSGLGVNFNNISDIFVRISFIGQFFT